MNTSWTVKIAGVSGTGKTTVMEALQQRLPQHQTVIYSQLLKKHNWDQALADIKLSEIIHSGGLVLMDDHLEFDNPNKTQNYLRENTRGLVLLDVPLRDLLMRITLDPCKSRDVDIHEISQNLIISREKAVRLSQETKTPLLVIPNLDGEVERSIAVITAFVTANSP